MAEPTAAAKQAAQAALRRGSGSALCAAAEIVDRGTDLVAVLIACNGQQAEQSDMEDEVARFPQIAPLGGERPDTAGLVTLGDPPPAQPPPGGGNDRIRGGSGLSGSVVR